MNNSGKERLASDIANLAINILLKHEVVIRLGWKNDQGDGVHDGSNENGICLREEPTVTLSVTTNMEASTDRLVQDDSILVGPRVSKRHKRPPIIKSDDILW